VIIRASRHWGSAAQQSINHPGWEPLAASLKAIKRPSEAARAGACDRLGLDSIIEHLLCVDPPARIARGMIVLMSDGSVLTPARHQRA
jgi:hypothetical protein